MTIGLVSRTTAEGARNALSINGWTVRGYGRQPLVVAGGGLSVRVDVLLATACGPVAVAGPATALCASAYAESRAGGADGLAGVRAAQRALRDERGAFDRVTVHVAAVMLNGTGDALVIGSGIAPVYLASEGYAARIDPFADDDRGLASLEVGPHLLRRIRAASGQQIILAGMPFEDLGLALEWPSGPAVGSATWLASRADECAARGTGDPLIAVLTVSPRPPSASPRQSAWPEGLSV